MTRPEIRSFSLPGSAAPSKTPSPQQVHSSDGGQGWLRCCRSNPLIPTIPRADFPLPLYNELRRTPQWRHHTISHRTIHSRPWPAQPTSSFHSTWTLPSYPDSAHFSIPGSLLQESFTNFDQPQPWAPFRDQFHRPFQIRRRTVRNWRLFMIRLLFASVGGSNPCGRLTAAIEFPQMANQDTEGSGEDEEEEDDGGGF